MTTQSTVIVAGFGQMGHAMQALLGERAALHIWEISPEKPQLPDTIGAAAARADFLLVCVPTLAHAAVLGPLVGRLGSRTATLSIAKGLDEAGRCAADILSTRLPAHPWGVLGGPMIANELIAGKPGFAELGTSDPALVERARRLFPDRLGLEANLHPRSVSWCGVLKNIYAPLVGVSDGLGWGDNARGHLVMSALREMRDLLPEFAGAGADAYGDAGFADFVTTVTSPSSHHYALGRRLSAGDVSNLECEGVHSLRVLQARGKLPARAFPLLTIAAGIVKAPGDVASGLRAWLAAAG